MTATSMPTSSAGSSPCSGLFVRALHGDGDAATQLYHACVPELKRRLGRRMMWSDAEDIAHDALLTAFRHGARFQPDQSFRAWLHTIASRLAMNHRRNETRRRTRELAFVDLEEANRAEDSDPGAQQSRILAQCLARLPETEQRLLKLRYSDNRSPTEIAATMGRRRGAVSVHLHRVCQKLRTEVQQARHAPITPFGTSTFFRLQHP